MTRLTCVAWRNPADFSTVASRVALTVGVALAVVPTWARAETQVRGTPQAVVVEVQNAPIEEVLVALTDAFKVQFKSSANLDKRLTGTYEGTLQQAVSRILKGYDFVVKSGQAGIEITLLGSGKPVAVVGARPATRPAEAAAAPQPPTASAESADRPVPILTSRGPTPPIGDVPAAQRAAPPVPDVSTPTAVLPVPTGAASTVALPVPDLSMPTAVQPVPTGTAPGG
jgi:hypothetical protein